jgi:hypothetical protein
MQRENSKALFRPQLESLDRRDVPSAVVTVTGNLLTINCDGAEDTVVLYDDGAGGITGFTHDQFNNHTDISVSGINEIVIGTGDGNDRVAYFLVNDLRAGQQQLLSTVALGAGNDFFGASIHNPTTGVGSDIQAGASLILGVFVGDGNDIMVSEARRDVDIGTGGRLKTVFLGGNGNDLISMSYRGENDGAMGMTGHGEAGNDVFLVNASEDAGSTGLVGCVLLGQDGRDLFFVSLNTQSATTPSSVIDGGADLDLAFVWSTFAIPVVNM